MTIPISSRVWCCETQLRSQAYLPAEAFKVIKAWEISLGTRLVKLTIIEIQLLYYMELRQIVQLFTLNWCTMFSNLGVDVSQGKATVLCVYEIYHTA